MQAHRNDEFTKKTKRVKRLEDPRRCELYNIFREYHIVDFDGGDEDVSIELLEEVWGKIRQWLHDNNDNDVLLKQAVSHKAHSISTRLHIILYWMPPLDIIDIFVK